MNRLILNKHLSSPAGEQMTFAGGLDCWGCCGVIISSNSCGQEDRCCVPGGCEGWMEATGSSLQGCWEVIERDLATRAT